MNFLRLLGDKALSLFLKDKFVGQVAQLVTAAGVSYLATQIPVVPEWVALGLSLAFDLPPQTHLDPIVVTATLTPLVKIGISDAVQAIVVKWNNRVLTDLRESPSSSYVGKVDGLVGPKAQAAIDDLLTRIQ